MFAAKKLLDQLTNDVLWKVEQYFGIVQANEWADSPYVWEKR
jgi:hypothetical protein